MSLYCFAVCLMQTKVYKAHNITVYYYLKRRLLSVTAYSAVTALAGGAFYAVLLVILFLLYIVLLKRSEYIIVYEKTLEINKGIFTKQKIKINKTNLCTIKARRGILGRLFGFVKIRLYSPSDIAPLAKIILKNEDFIEFERQMY